MIRIAKASYGPGNIGIWKETHRGQERFVVTRENHDGVIVSRFGYRKTEEAARVFANEKWANWLVPRTF